MLPHDDEFACLGKSAGMHRVEINPARQARPQKEPSWLWICRVTARVLAAAAPKKLCDHKPMGLTTA